MTVRVTTSDLDTLLALNGNIDTERAQLLLGLAKELCCSIVDPLPDNSRSVVLTVAARAYINPSGVQAQTVGPESIQYGTAYGSLYLTKGDVATLRRLSGGGGAFTIDPTPADAGTKLYPWDLNIWDLSPNDELPVGGSSSGGWEVEE